DAGSHNALTQRISEKAAPADADIVGDRAVLAGIVVDIHTASAQAADHFSLQQSGAFSRRSGIPLEAQSLGRLPQLLLIAFILFPADVAGMRITNQHLPLLLRQPFVPEPPIGALMVAAAAKDVGSCIPRVMESRAGAAQRQRCPH